MGFNRDKYKPTTLAASEKQDKDNKEKRPKSGSNFENHTIENGINRFRAFPFHPDGGGNSWRVAKCVSFLDVTKQKRDEQTNRLIEGQFEVGKKPVFNAKVHGGLSADPVEVYMDIAKRIAIPNFTTDENIKKQIWSTITGYSDKKKVYHSGIIPVDSWVCYANKLIDGAWKFGTLEFKETTKKQLIEIALEMSNGESPDIYTDPEEGYVFRIEKKKDDSGTKYFSALDRKLIDKVNEQLQILALTELELVEFEKQTPLHKRFVNSYKRSDFDMQIEGLERFDKALAAKGFPIEVFAIDEFLDAITAIDSQIKDEAPSGTDDLPFDVDNKKPVAATTVAPLVTKSTVKTAVRKAAISKPAPEPEPEEQEHDGPIEQPGNDGVVPTPVMTTAQRLEMIKNKHKK